MSLVIYVEEIQEKEQSPKDAKLENTENFLSQSNFEMVGNV